VTAPARRIRARFWTCPIDGHSEGTWHDGLTQTVEWRKRIAYCLAPGCGRTSVDPAEAVADLRVVTDDGRNWWLLGAVAWMGVHLYQARTARAALAEYRRDLTAAERSDGRSRRDIAELLRAASLTVLLGPMTTVEAYQYDLAASYAEELQRWKDYNVTVAFAVTPMTCVDMAAKMDPVKAALIRVHVRAAYLPDQEV
jgi:hypothetical protein